MGRMYRNSDKLLDNLNFGGKEFQSLVLLIICIGSNKKGVELLADLLIEALVDFVV